MKNNRHRSHCFCLFSLLLLVSACSDWPAIEKVFGGTQEQKNMPAQKEKQVVAAQVEDTQESKKTTPTHKGKQAAKVAAKQEQAAGWVLQCPRNKKQCYIQQYTFAPESKMRFVGVLAGYLGAKENPRLLFSLPLGVLLAPGMTFDIDSGQKTKLPIRVCIADGCKANMPLNKALLTRLKQGKQINLFFIHAATQKTIKVRMPLQGFTKAYATLSAKRK